MIEEVARETIKDIDRIVGALREDAAAPLTPLPGIEGLPALVERHRAGGLDFNLRIIGDAAPPIPAAVDRAGYRIAQEALTNAARHGSGSARLTVVRGANRLELAVTNPVSDGPAERPSGGRGILGMRERATLLGGSLEAGPGDAGFLVRALLPYDRRAPMSAPVRVMLVDDDDLVRGLCSILSSDERIEAVEEAQDGRVAVQRARHRRPELVLMDVCMPELDGIAATRELIRVVPDAKVVILTTFEDDEYILGALRAGASGFLLKRSSPEQLIDAILTVAAGDALLSPSVTRRVIDRVARQPVIGAASDPRLDELTPREREVLDLIAQGLSNPEIATALVVEATTVKSHVKHVLAKLGARDRVHAVILAYELGLVAPGSRPL